MSLKKQKHRDGSSGSYDPTLREVEEAGNINSSPIHFSGSDAPRRMSIYDETPMLNPAYPQSSFIPTNTQPQVPNVNAYNNWTSYTPQNVVMPSVSPVNFPQTNQNFSYIMPSSLQPEVLPGNYQFTQYPNNLPNQTTVPPMEMFTQQPTTSSDISSSNGLNSSAQQLYDSIPNLTVDTLMVLMEHIAKSDNVVQKLLSDAKRQASHADHYKFLMLGFRIGMCAGMKLDGNEAGVNVFPSTIDYSNMTGQAPEYTQTNLPNIPNSTYTQVQPYFGGTNNTNTRW